MKKYSAFITILAILNSVNINTHNAFAQTDSPVLMTIKDKPITKNEFENIYHKNSPKDKPKDDKALQEYLELFINFKLKVQEAEDLGLDTTQAFKNELEGYRKQLAKPYLTDNEVNEKLVKEAYERLKREVRASHILIRCEPNALPKDTLQAYNKALEIRKQLLKGEDFAKLARQYSADPSVADNNGDLGYFTALQMVYPFETACYNLKPGEISMPVRTRYGYHIIKVTDNRPSVGQVRVAHIMVKIPRNATKEDSINAKNKILEIQQKLKNGEDFAKLAEQYSDDKGSAKKGGELPFFGPGKMVFEFEQASFALKNPGDISEPVQTQFGWHLIKLLERKPVGSFDELKTELKNKIAKDSRSEKSKESLIARIKKENGFKENLKARDEFYTKVDSSFFIGKWSAEKASTLNKELFTIGTKKYTQTDFAKFIELNQSKTERIPIPSLVNNLYKQFVEKQLLAYYEDQLPEKFLDYRLLLNEYRDGILLFELTDRKVWSAAVKDTVGLKEFYEKNKNNYLWDERADAVIYKCKDQEIATKVKKNITAKKKKSDDELLKEINKDSQLNLQIESGKYLKGENDIIDKVNWNPGEIQEIKQNDQIILVYIKKILPKEPKTLIEARGIITSDYQNFLEKKWIEELRNKYPVKINQDVLKTVQ
jgi:peptidyl-prolyl cis-trans isomerase SurA